MENSPVEPRQKVILSFFCLMLSGTKDKYATLGFDPKNLRQFLTEVNKDDRSVDAASARMFPSAAWVPRQREKAASSESYKLQLTVCRSIRRKQSSWESHRSQGYGVLEREKKKNRTHGCFEFIVKVYQYSLITVNADTIGGYGRHRQTHDWVHFFLTFRGKLLREVLWEPVLQRKRSSCSWADSDISTPSPTVGTSRRWYAVQVIPVKWAVRIKWASITMFLDTCIYQEKSK